ncbi:MAG: serine/threonine protein kinase [Deltaproteobacteria bacterium]|nr:serine/threonine protein kinase [Deltaproteobacteria bacterium]
MVKRQPLELMSEKPQERAAKATKGRLLRAGQALLGRFEILSVLGEGGQGAVYLARQFSTGQKVALKVLRAVDGQVDSELQEARSQREMEVIARLGHPHIVRLLDSFHFDGQRVLVLEHVSGEPLSKRLKRQGALGPALARRVIMQVLEALASAHGAGIVHRDLKPENIMLTGAPERPSAKVLDFGIATVAHEKRDSDYQTLSPQGSLIGTPSYMAPEQILQGLSTPASDLYAVGIILLEALTGQRAVTGRTPAEICLKQVQEPVYMPADILVSHLGPIIRRACEKLPEHRYPSAEAFLADLEAASDATEAPAELENAHADAACIGDDARTAAMPPVAVTQDTDDRVKPWKGRRAAILVAALAAFAGTGGTWYLLRPRHSSQVANNTGTHELIVPSSAPAVDGGDTSVTLGPAVAGPDASPAETTRVPSRVPALKSKTTTRRSGGRPRARARIPEFDD